MTDKYEQFKEFVREKYFPNPTRWGGIFNDFEKECAKKEKENEIKKVLDKYIVKIGFSSINGDDIEINSDSVDKCYNELKEKDLIK